MFFGVFTVVVNKKDIKILTELLGLENVKVISHRLHGGIGIILQIESKILNSICPKCSTKSHCIKIIDTLLKTYPLETNQYF